MTKKEIEGCQKKLDTICKKMQELSTKLGFTVDVMSSRTGHITVFTHPISEECFLFADDRKDNAIIESLKKLEEN